MARKSWLMQHRWTVVSSIITVAVVVAVGALIISTMLSPVWKGSGKLGSIAEDDNHFALEMAGYGRGGTYYTDNAENLHVGKWYGFSYYVDNSWIVSIEEIGPPLFPFSPALSLLIILGIVAGIVLLVRGIYALCSSRRRER